MVGAQNKVVGDKFNERIFLYTIFHVFTMIAIQQYHWGQKYYLPNLCSRRISLENSMRVMCTNETSRGTTTTELLDKITLPKSVSN